MLLVPKVVGRNFQERGKEATIKLLSWANGLILHLPVTVLASGGDWGVLGTSLQGSPSLATC